MSNRHLSLSPNNNLTSITLPLFQQITPTVSLLPQAIDNEEFSTLLGPILAKKFKLNKWWLLLTVLFTIPHLSSFWVMLYIIPLEDDRLLLQCAEIPFSASTGLTFRKINEIYQAFLYLKKNACWFLIITIRFNRLSQPSI